MSGLAERTLAHLWLPCTPMAGRAPADLLEVVSAQGPYLRLADGREVIDAISSWWCKTLGHGHPRLRAALVAQAGKLEHVIAANATHETLAALTERLGRLVPGLPRVFYGGDGSMAVEIALKLALHASRLAGHPERRRFAALQGGYHGETQLCLAVGDQDLYGAGLLEELPRAHRLGPLPHVVGREDPLWGDCSAQWPAIERQLEAAAPTLCSVIVEPVLQGAGEMRLYSPDLLARLRRFCDAHGIYLVADEILTGFGRLGRMLACEHAGVRADLVCLSKGLTAGWLPMSAVLVSEPIFELCNGAGGREPFLHSNTYCGNALAAAVALEALRLYDELDIAAMARALEPELRAAWQRIGERTGALRSLRT
ncbi:MAG TPA: aminotransferase class III-fold pyridoxal phosphate-dependent enzyme, partial [Myxococcales bacterium]|nr:aminotransferase class III-fold pyridoxal phosphate-dependent enzyme [Myxococcales bacterium]